MKNGSFYWVMLLHTGRWQPAKYIYTDSFMLIGSDHIYHPDDFAQIDNSAEITR